MDALVFRSPEEMEALVLKVEEIVLRHGDPQFGRMHSRTAHDRESGFLVETEESWHMERLVGFRKKRTSQGVWMVSHEGRLRVFFLSVYRDTAWILDLGERLSVITERIEDIATLANREYLIYRDGSPAQWREVWEWEDVVG